MARFDVVGSESSMLAGMQARAREDIFYELGMMYATGRSVDYDPIEAHKWMNLAAMRGNKEAAQYRSELAAEMSQDQVAAAQKWAREWLTVH